MQFNLSPFARRMSSRIDLSESAAPARLVEGAAKVGGAGPGLSICTENGEVLADWRKLSDPRPSQPSEEQPRFAGIGPISAGMADHTMDTQLDRAVDRPASDRPAAMPERRLRERLRWPLMLALPIVLAAFGAAEYLAEEPYVSTDD